MRKCLTALIAVLIGVAGVLGPVAPAGAQSKGEVVMVTRVLARNVALAEDDEALLEALERGALYLAG